MTDFNDLAEIEAKQAAELAAGLEALDGWALDFADLEAWDLGDLAEILAGWERDAAEILAGLGLG